MRKGKILLALACVLVCAFALVVVSSAETYTVYSDSEFNTAYSEATDGDTIVIKSSISATFNFGKSITYILDGDGIVWTAGVNNDATGKTVTITSNGGNNTFLPNSKMWCNSYALKEPDLTSTTWNLGSLNATGTVTLDLTQCTDRLFYFNPGQGGQLRQINLKQGSRVTNLAAKYSGNKFVYATEVNMYDGAEIFGNKLTNYTPLVSANTFNMYGGKIYGNFFGCYGFVLTSCASIYGGEIVDNYMDTSAGTGLAGSFINSTAGQTQTLCYIYSCNINNNLLMSKNTSQQAIIRPAGASLVVGQSYGENNRITENWGETGPTKVGSVYTITDYSLQDATYCPVRGSVTIQSYALVFKDVEGKVINAYIVDEKGNVKKSVDNSTEIAVPAGFTWANMPNKCVTTSVDTTKHGTYYVAIPHAFLDDDHDCTTAQTCTECGYMLNAKEHTIVLVVTYENTLFSKGHYSCDCTNEGCTVLDEEREALPIFTEWGYTVAQYGQGSVMQGFVVNEKALDDYNKANKDAQIVDFGVIAGTSLALGETTDVFAENGELTTNKVAQKSFMNQGFAIFEMKISGFNQTVDVNGTPLDLTTIGIYNCGYYLIKKGESYESYYMDQGTITEILPEAFTFASKM